MYWNNDYGFVCNLSYELKTPLYNTSYKELSLDENKVTSDNCQLEAVTYSLKDKSESINFVPKEL